MSKKLVGPYISSLTIRNFRSYKELNLKLDQRPIVLFGPNGSGKTNCIEAISLLHPGKGLRSAKKNQLLHISSKDKNLISDWAVHAKIENEENIFEVSTGVDSNDNLYQKNRKFLLNGEKVNSTEIVSQLSLNWFTPQMPSVIAASESIKRKFFDRLVAGFDPAHLSRVLRFEKLSRQRIKLIEKNYNDENWFSLIERKMSETAVAIIASRISVANLLDKITSNPIISNFPNVSLNWSGYVEEWLESASSIDVEDKISDYLKKLRYQNSHEILGPTQSKLNFFYGKNKASSDYCSTGQQKFILVSIVLAFSKLLSDRKKLPPILLLDEVSAHLDDKNFQAFFDASIENTGQIWMTGTNLDLFKKLKFDKKLQYLEVNDSNVTQFVDL